MEKTSIRQSNKGFTLVELCVTLVLFAVLATITTMGLLKWQEYSTNKEMEDKAELIYMAVRNSIAKLKANNVLDETEGWGHSDSSTLGSDGKYHMVCTSGDYDDYINGTLSQTSAKLLFNMTADYLHDKKILNYNIVVSYSEDGTVSNVFYSDRTGMSYTSSSGKINVINNSSDSLFENVIGAYIIQ